MHQIEDPIKLDPPSQAFHESIADGFVRTWVKLPRNFEIPPADLVAILDNRRSRRSVAEPNPQQLSTLLWLTLRQIGANGSVLRLPYPSAGGIGSVRTVILTNELGCWCYDRSSHRAGILDIDDTVHQRIRNEANTFFQVGDASILLFYAARDAIGRYYQNPESLVLREAGAILGLMSLVSESLGLSFCPLGTQAGSWLALLGLATERVIPAGACVLGASQALDGR